MTDVRNTIKRRLKGQPLVMLGACCVGPAIQDQVAACVEDALASDTWVDVKVSQPQGSTRPALRERSVDWVADGSLDVNHGGQTVSALRDLLGGGSIT